MYARRMFILGVGLFGVSCVFGIFDLVLFESVARQFFANAMRAAIGVMICGIGLAVFGERRC